MSLCEITKWSQNGVFALWLHTNQQAGGGEGVLQCSLVQHSKCLCRDADGTSKRGLPNMQFLMEVLGDVWGRSLSSSHLKDFAGRGLNYTAFAPFHEADFMLLVVGHPILQRHPILMTSQFVTSDPSATLPPLTSPLNTPEPHCQLSWFDGCQQNADTLSASPSTTTRCKLQATARHIGRLPHTSFLLPHFLSKMQGAGRRRKPSSK